MTAVGRAIMESNPFCTRHVRPGAIPYIFPVGESAQQLVERLREYAWRGEIIGPHGSGKSTLVESLVPELRRAGVRPVVVAIHDWSRRLPADWSQTLVRARSVLVIDGFEQLPWFARAWVKILCRLLRCGLIVTAHQPMGLPLLFRTYVSPATARRVIERLHEATYAILGDEEFAQLLASHGGNLREVIFELHDRYERRRRAIE